MGMTTKEFGRQFGCSHPAVLKWESGQSRISPVLDAYLKLFMLDYLKTNNEEFREYFNKLKECMVLKKEKENNKPLEINIDELRVAI